MTGSIESEVELKGTIVPISYISGKMIPEIELIGKITIPTNIIPSNYGLITWNGSVLIVS